MGRVGVFLLMTLMISSANAQKIDRPIVHPEDGWTYLSTTEKGANWHQIHSQYTVLRANESEILVSVKEIGSTLPGKEQLLGSDWSRFRNVNGHEVVVNRPLAFPLEPGKTWEINYTENHPNRAHDSESWKFKYKVVGREKVTVPAGTFKAIKVEAEGEWTADIAEASIATTQTQVDQQGATAVAQTAKRSAQTVTGRAYKALWYVPEVKRFVKGVEEYFGSDGTRNERYEIELESFKVQ